MKSEEADKERDSSRKEDKAKREEESKKINEWPLEEISRLSKATVKFPAGVPNRWKLIAEFVGDRT